MDVTDNQQLSQFDDALKLFEENLQEQTLTIQDIPELITMTHRGKCSICGTYATHMIVAAKSPTIEMLSHWIEVVIWNVWPKVVTHIEDEAIDKACSKLSWYRDQ